MPRRRLEDESWNGWRSAAIKARALQKSHRLSLDLLASRFGTTRSTLQRWIERDEALSKAGENGRNAADTGVGDEEA
jgi:AraC-like DNA-binding protein